MPGFSNPDPQPARTVKVCFLMGRREAPQPKAHLVQLEGLLERAGCRVTRLTEQNLFCLAAPPQADVFLMLSRSPFWFSLAHIVERRGAVVYNGARPSERAYDKLVVNALLSAAGVPVPPSYSTVNVEHVAQLLSDGPLLVKKRKSERSEGLSVIRRVEELDDVVFGRSPVLLQRLLDSCAPETKLYVIGTEVFAFQRDNQGRSFDRGRTRTEPTPEQGELAHRCAEILELQFFGLDVIHTEVGDFVVDVNLFPGFRGIPEAPYLISEFVLKDRP